MRNLDKVTQNWRLFYKLTADFLVTADDIEACYLITQIIRSENPESCVYFLARLIDNRLLALKVFKDRRDLKEDTVITEIFEREPSAVVTLHQTFYRPELPRYRFILMDRGIPLKQFILTLPKIADGRIHPKIRELLRGMAAAARAVHRAGYHHRDLRAENFVVVNEEGQDLPKLIDFGLALPKSFTDHSINNYEWIRSPEFVYLNRDSPEEQVIYQDHHDVYALCLTFMDILELRPTFYFPRNCDTELVKFYKTESHYCESEQVFNNLKLKPWQQAVRLLFFAGIPPRTLRCFYDSPVGNYLVRRFRDFEQLDYLHSKILASTLVDEPVFLAMLQHALQWEPRDRVPNFDQLFDLYLDRLGDI